MAKKFILLTTGRSGSTALMDALAAHPDILVPNKQIDCRDNEILNPLFVRDIAQAYQRLSGNPVTDELSLIQAFYETGESSAYAGFKSMPNRHQKLSTLLRRDDLQVITLIRRDLASTIASFITAVDTGSWRREGEQHANTFVFGGEYEKRVRGHLTYLLRSLRVLNNIPGAIRLIFEDLCDPHYRHAQLDDYFGRPVALINPRTPLSGADYVENWDAFVRFIRSSIRDSQRR